MRALCDVLGDPQHAYPVIHITGTNGKGSVARMVTALLQARGLSVGTYTSPHLERINERLAWDGEPDRRRRARRADRRGRRGRGAGRGARPRTSRSSPRPPSAGSPTWRSTSRSSRSGCSVATTPPTWPTRTVAVVHQRRPRPHRRRRRLAGGDRRREGGHRRSRAATLVLGETDPDLRPIFTAEGPRRDLGRATTTSGARPTAWRSAAGWSTCARRRAGVEDVFLPLHGAHQGDNAALAAGRGRGLLRPAAPRTRS